MQEVPQPAADSHDWLITTRQWSKALPVSSAVTLEHRSWCVEELGRWTWCISYVDNVPTMRIVCQLIGIMGLF